MLKIRSLYSSLAYAYRRHSYIVPIVLGAGLFMLAAQAGQMLFPAPVRVVAHVRIEKPDADIQSELKAFRAPELAMKVMNELHLASNADFMSGSARGSAEAYIQDFLAPLIGLPPRAVASSSDMVQKWSQTVHISAQAGAPVLDIVVRAAHAQLAKDIADTAARLFAEGQAGTSLGNSPSPLDELRAELTRAQAARDAAHAVEASLLAQDNRSNAQSVIRLGERAKKIKALMAQGQVFEAADELNTPSLRALNDERRKIKIELQINSKTLLDQHPVMKELSRRLAIVEAQLREATSRAVKAMDDVTAAASDAHVSPPLIAALDQNVLDAQQKVQDAVRISAESSAAARYRRFLPAERIGRDYGAAVVRDWRTMGGLGAAAGLLIFALLKGFARRAAPPSMPVEAQIKPRFKIAPAVQSIAMPMNHAGKARPCTDLQEKLQESAQKSSPQVILLHGFDHDVVEAELAALAPGKQFC